MPVNFADVTRALALADQYDLLSGPIRTNAALLPGIPELWQGSARVKHTEDRARIDRLITQAADQVHAAATALRSHASLLEQQWRREEAARARAEAQAREQAGTQAPAGAGGTSPWDPFRSPFTGGGW